MPQTVDKVTSAVFFLRFFLKVINTLVNHFKKNSKYGKIYNILE